MLQASAGSSLRDVVPLRPRWADLQDSSQENAGDSQPPPPLSQGSYNEDSPEDASRAGLTGRLARAASLAPPAAGATQEPRCADPDTAGAASAGDGSTAQSTPHGHGHRVAPAVLAGQMPPPPGPIVAQTLGVAPSAPMAGVTAAITSAPGGGMQANAGAATGLAPLSWRLRAWRRGATAHGQPQAAGGEHGALRPVSPPRTPARRRRRNELEQQSSLQTPLGKKLRGPPPQTPDASDNWPRRLQKRRAAIAAIKRMPEYLASVEGRSNGLVRAEDLPLTPEPDDCTVSKRQWEAAVMRWRSLLRHLALPACIDLDPDPSAEP
mmetsp:Transcript_135794/g.378442  ORF Transcript_135794/g.378442 Transcript_135794/m.378442 type:complete len:323 (+) Transcript_135794:77-1045(+)